MRIFIHSQGIGVAAALVDCIRLKLARALRQHRRDVVRVEVRISSEVGLAGARQYCCRVQVQLSDIPAAYALVAGPDLYEAIDRAGQRVSTLVAQQVERSRTRRREGRSSGVRTDCWTREPHPEAGGLRRGQ